MDGATGTRVQLSGKEYLYFGGTSYFQLHRHPELIHAAVRAMESYGMGSATSRNLTGTTQDQLELEKDAAAFFGAEDAAYLPSGYLSNLAGLSGLYAIRPFHKIFIDECAHYSLREAALASGKQIITFSHLNSDALEWEMQQNLKQDEIPLIASDGLFPISASLAPAGKYLELAGQFGGVVWLDDAHGVGILGKEGRGTAEELGLVSGQLYFGATLSKAFGAYGGIIPGRGEFISRVKKSGAFIGSNAPLSAAVAAARKGLELVSTDSGLRMRLRKNAHYLKQGLATLGLDIHTDEIPIASFCSGNAESMIEIQQALMSEGFYIQYTDYQGAGKEGVLRIVVSSEHSKEEIDLLLKALSRQLNSGN